MKWWRPYQKLPNLFRSLCSPCLGLSPWCYIPHTSSPRATSTRQGALAKRTACRHGKRIRVGAGRPHTRSFGDWGRPALPRQMSGITEHLDQ